MVQRQSVKNNLICIKINFHQIVKTIKILEKSITRLVDMINLIKITFTQLEQILGEKGDVVKIKIFQF